MGFEASARAVADAQKCKNVCAYVEMGCGRCGCATPSVQLCPHLWLSDWWASRMETHKYLIARGISCGCPIFTKHHVVDNYSYFVDEKAKIKK